MIATRARMAAAAFLSGIVGSVTYLFRDLFTTADSAPITSPRTTEPGPGTLVAVQTGGSMNITTGQLNITSAPSAWGSQGVRDNATTTRTAGRRVVFTFMLNSITSNNRCIFGWNVSAGVSFSNVDVWGFLMTGNGSTIDVKPSNASGSTSYGTLATLAASTEYQLMLIYRTSGLWAYLKGGAYTSWTLFALMSTCTGNDYHAFGNHSQTGVIHEIAVPDNLWTDTPLISESFATAPEATQDYVAEYGSNPVIDVDDNASESVEQYTPAPIIMDNGDIWVYVKGTTHSYAYKSTDNGVTFSLQNGGSIVANGREPAAVFDSATSTIHLYTKDSSGVRYWTAADTDPASFTEDAGSPILTPAEFKTALGLTNNPTDLIVGDVIKIGSTFYFYGTAADADDGGKYKIWYATGTDFDDINPQGFIITPDDAQAGSNLVQTPSVFKWSGSSTYVMIFTVGTITEDALRYLRTATSSDGETWTINPHYVALAPRNGTSWNTHRVYAASILKEHDSPYVAPVEISSKYLLYASGSDPSSHDNTGLYYLQDNGADTVEANFPVTQFIPSTDGAGDVDSSGGDGVEIVERDGLLVIEGGALTHKGVVTNNPSTAALATFETGKADVVGILNYTKTGNSVGFVLRWTNNNNYWAVISNPTQMVIVEVNAGTQTVRASNSTGGNTGTIVVSAVGSVIRGWRNDGAVVEYSSATLNQTETVHGLWVFGTDTTDITNFAIYDRTETGEIPN